MTKWNSPAPCPELTKLMNLCHDRVCGGEGSAPRKCAIENKCIEWYDGHIGKMSCEELVKGFLEMRNEEGSISQNT